MNLTRRGFIGALGALVAAPLVAKVAPQPVHEDLALSLDEFSALYFKPAIEKLAREIGEYWDGLGLPEKIQTKFDPARLPE